MNAIEAIKGGLAMGDMISMGYLGDLSDEEMMHRPDPKANHIKWQVGHLIAADNQMINGCMEGAIPPLPDGFAEKYEKEKSTSDDASEFDSKETLMGLYAQQKESIHAALEKLSEADLDKPSPESMQEYAPTVGSAFNMIGMHWVMHAGQWAVIRRQLGREPLF